jgi:hypothetical protein
VKEFMRLAGDGECELRQLYEVATDTCAKTANINS